MTLHAVRIALALAACAAVVPGARCAGTAALPDCKGQTSVGFDAENGAFDGMSHSGVLLVVRNIGSAPCRLPGLPRLGFEDSAGAPLPLARSTPAGLHHGPVVLPVGAAAGAEATEELRWVSGDVYDGHNCATPARVTVILGPDRSTQPWPAGQLCGPAGAPIPYSQPPLHTDPVLNR